MRANSHKDLILKLSIALPISRRVLCATATAALLTCYGAASFAATPKDTLVVAWAIDDIITMDPSEAFEISAGEVMGNAYDRLLRYDVNDPSKLLPGPQLPTGYAGCILLAMLPPLWFAVMHPRLAALKQRIDIAPTAA